MLPAACLCKGGARSETERKGLLFPPVKQNCVVCIATKRTDRCASSDVAVCPSEERSLYLSFCTYVVGVCVFTIKKEEDIICREVERRYTDTDKREGECVKRRRKRQRAREDHSYLIDSSLVRRGALVD